MFFILILILAVFLSSYSVIFQKNIINNNAAVKKITNSIPLLRGLPNDLVADKILGHDSFKEVIPKETVPFKLAGSGGVLVDTSVKPNRVYVFDGMNSRILGYRNLGYCSNKSPCTDNSDCQKGQCLIDLGKGGAKTPDLVIGQTGLYGKSACNQDASFETYPIKVQASQSTICSVKDDERSYFEGGSAANMSMDKEGNLYFPDSINNRVLKYNKPFETDNIADDVWGQDNFANRNVNKGLYKPTDSSLSFGTIFTKPGVEIDKQGNLWVSDVDNNRVLRFSKVEGLISKKADLVLGQDNFNDFSAGSSLNKLHSPSAVRLDSKGQVYVSDTFNNRILVYAPPFSNGMMAQEFKKGLNLPQSIFIDSSIPGNEKIIYSDNSKLFINNNLNQSQNNYEFSAEGIQGSIGVTSRNSIILPVSSGTQNLLLLRPPYTSAEILYKKPDSADNSYDNHNYLSNKGFLSLRGVVVTNSQIIVSDAHRLAYWNTSSPTSNISNGQPYDGYFGNLGIDEKFNHISSDYQRISAGNKYLWVLSASLPNENNMSVESDIILRNSIEKYLLPVKQGDRPVEIIYLKDLIVNGLPIKNKYLYPTDISVNEEKGYFWLALPRNDRVIRVKIPPLSGNYTYIVDTIIGGEDIPNIKLPFWGRTCESDPQFPSKSICYPGSITEDKYGNLVISELSLEYFGGKRLLIFDRNKLNNRSQANTIMKLYSSDASKIFENVQAWKPAFNSANVMIYGVNAYYDNFPRIVSNILAQTGSRLMIDDLIKDFYAQAYSSYFDKNDNLYITDLNKGSLYIYLKPIK